VEYDHLKLFLTDDAVEITLFMTDDKRVRRIHWELYKLDKVEES
jgi:hypothetical protein